MRRVNLAIVAVAVALLCGCCYCAHWYYEDAERERKQCEWAPHSKEYRGDAGESAEPPVAKLQPPVAKLQPPVVLQVAPVERLLMPDDYKPNERAQKIIALLQSSIDVEKNYAEGSMDYVGSGLRIVGLGKSYPRVMTARHTVVSRKNEGAPNVSITIIHPDSINKSRTLREQEAIIIELDSTDITDVFSQDDLGHFFDLAAERLPKLQRAVEERTHKKKLKLLDEVKP
jgi:hypothetical protein